MIPASTTWRARPRSATTASSRAAIGPRGSARTGRRRSAASAASSRSTHACSARCIRRRSCARCAVSSARSGTIRLRGVGGGGRADVGDVVDQRGVGLVPDRARPRASGTPRRPGTAPRRRTAGGPRRCRRRGPARSRRRRDRGPGRSAASRISGTAWRALRRGVDGAEPHGGPARRRDGEHVVLGGARPRRDQADAAREPRRTPLARRVEEPLGGQQRCAAVRCAPAARRRRRRRISSTRSESVPRPKKYDGLPWTTTRAPSASGGTVPRDHGRRRRQVDRDVRGRVTQHEERGARARAAR